MRNRLNVSDDFPAPVRPTIPTCKIKLAKSRRHQLVRLLILCYSGVSYHLQSNRWTGFSAQKIQAACSSNQNDANYTTLQLRTTTKIMVTFSIVKASNFTPNTLFIPSPQSDYHTWGISWISSVPPHKSWIIISNYTISYFHILTNSLFTPFHLMTQKSQLLKALLKNQ